MPNKPAWDRRGHGTWEFTPAERARVLALLQTHHVGRSSAVFSQNLAGEAVLEQGRALRAILRDIDGKECVLSADDDGIFVAEFYEDTVKTTRRYRSQAHKMLERADRRDAMALQLPRRQGDMFAGDDTSDESDNEPLF